MVNPERLEAFHGEVKYTLDTTEDSRSQLRQKCNPTRETCQRSEDDLQQGTAASMRFAFPNSVHEMENPETIAFSAASHNEAPNAPLMDSSIEFTIPNKTASAQKILKPTESRP
jgi:hypothetical protein